MIRRTIDGLLLEKIIDPDLVSDIPASEALLRFKAKHGEAIFKGDEKPDGIYIEMLVIPVKLRVTSSVLIAAPSLVA